MKHPELDVDSFKERLLKRREELLDLLSHSEDPLKLVELDQTRVGRVSRMDAMQAHAMAQESIRRARSESRRIAAALRRIDSGEFGDCLRCGAMIPEGRLNVDPAATLCLKCATDEEA